MFKSSSEYEQSRTRRAITESRANSGGLDDSAFQDNTNDSLDKYNELVKKKKALEAKASLLNANIKLSKRRHTFREAGQVSYETMMRWEAERQNIRAIVTDIDSQLTNMKADRRLTYQKDKLSFAECFLLMAKEVLAEEVYNRVVVATVHRMGEGQTTFGRKLYEDIS